MKRIEQILILPFILIAGCAIRDGSLVPLFSGTRPEEKVIEIIRGEKYAIADSLCKERLRAHHRDYSMHSLFGAVLLFQGKYIEAVDELNIAIPHLKEEELLAALINKGLAHLYLGNLRKFYRIMSEFQGVKPKERSLLSNERFLIALALFVQDNDTYKEYLGTAERAALPSGKNTSYSTDERIITLWIRNCKKPDSREKTSLVKLVASRPVTPVLPNTTLSSFALSILAERSRKQYFKPVIAGGI